MKKKTSMLLLVIALTFALCACGKPTPTETVDTFLSAAKAQDAETIKTVYAKEDFDFVKDVKIGQYENDAAGGFFAVLENELYPMLRSFEYTLSNEIIDGEKATVDVTFKTYAFGSAISSFMSNYTSQVLPMAFSGASDEEMFDLAGRILSTELGNLGDPSFEKTATITLSMGEDGWIVDEIDIEGDFFNAMTGNLVNTLANME